jgi:hypothetical protein
MNIDNLKEAPPWDWPESAGESIRAALRDRNADASYRLEAAELAGDITVLDDEMASILVAIVQSPDEPEELRGRAAISLGPLLEETDNEGFDDDGISEPRISETTFHAIQDALRAVHTDESVPKLVRRRVLEAAVRARQDWHTDAIRRAWSIGDEEWKMTAVFGMQYVPGFARDIIQALDDASPEVRFEAVRAAGVREVADAWPRIQAILNAPPADRDLLLAAIEAAPLVNPKEAGVALLDLSDSDDEEIAEAAMDAMSTASPESDDEEF